MLAPACALAILSGSCAREVDLQDKKPGTGAIKSGNNAAEAGRAPERKDDFILKPEWSPGSFSKDFVPGKNVDVNLGHSQQENIKALWFQLTGALPSEEEVAKWGKLLNENPRMRRIDLAVRMSESLGKTPVYSYGDPWQGQPRLLSAPEKKVKRDMGAVLMFFFNCPGGVNGKMSWANNHAPGMDRPAEICRMQDGDNGYYEPRNPGFWFMELLDARYAGLQFLLPNVYGPDLKDGSIDNLCKALAQIDGMGLDKTVKIGLFDDTWTWGKPYFDKFWKQIPDMGDTEACAKLLYDAKWKPFFSAVPRKHWYLFKGRPVIYFYNADTVMDPSSCAQVFKIMRKMFKDDFGIEPYLCADHVFWGEGADEVVDNRFRWYSLGKGLDKASVTMKDVTLTHAMVRWDSTARENKERERAAAPKDKIWKDDAILKDLLNMSQESDLLVIATWNDLGEGTGINRCYDYYWDGQWRKPSHFMELIRSSQEGAMLENKTTEIKEEKK